MPQSFTHPGITLNEKLMEIGMNVKEFALLLDMPEKTIQDLIKKERSISPEIALKFEKVLNIPAKFWLNYQENYNNAKAKTKIENKKLFLKNIKMKKSTSVPKSF